MKRYLLTADRGLEAIALEESGLPGEAGEGWIRVESADPDPLATLRTVCDIVAIDVEREAETLDQVREAAGDLEPPAGETFRVTCRHGRVPELTRSAVERAVGAAIQGKHGTPVDLESPAAVVRAELYGERLFLGRALTDRPLDERIRRGGALRSSLKPTTAAAMIRLVGAHEGPGRLIDPLCGAAVIPVEARAINPELTIECADWDAPTVDVARRTLVNHGIDDILPLVADARRLGERGERYDYIVTDPPYGVRQARRSPISELYRALLAAFERALARGGRVGIIVVKQGTFLRLVETTGLRVERDCPVGIGGMDARIFVLRSA